MRRSHKLQLYFALTFAISWTGVLLTESRYSRFAAMLAGPPVAAIALAWLLERAPGLHRLAQRLLNWRVGPVWYLTPLVAPLILVVVLLTLSFASGSFTPVIFAGGDAGAAIAAALVIGALAGFCEELGWTGYAARRLLRRHDWFDGGVLLGLLWALWHLLPDFLGNPTLDGALWWTHAALWFVALTAFRIFMTWVYSHTNSLPLAMLLHALFTSSQLVLQPAASAPALELVWYGLFALELWLLVAFVGLVGDVFASAAASKHERRRPLLGDYLVPDPMLSVTHAVTIDGRPEDVWPHLPRMQDDPFVVTAVEPGRDIVLTVPGDGAPLVSWEHYLEPQEDGRTRLIVRRRAARDGRLRQRWTDARHVRGIKRRVEAYS